MSDRLISARPAKSVRFRVIGFENARVSPICQAAAEGACGKPLFASGDCLHPLVAMRLQAADRVADAALDWLCGVVASYREGRRT